MKAITNFRAAGFYYCDKNVNAMFLDESPHEVKFINEENNRFDQYAVRIECCGHKIGYVPKGKVAPKISGNYNEFFSQCLKAGIEFKGICFRRIRSDDRFTRIDIDDLTGIPPTVIVLSPDSKIDLASFDPKDLIGNYEIECICSVSYADRPDSFQTSRGYIHYLPKYDEFCIWGGTDSPVESFDVEILEHDTSKNETMKCGFTFPKKVKISDEFIHKIYDRDTRFMVDEEVEKFKLVKKFIERFKQ